MKARKPSGYIYYSEKEEQRLKAKETSEKAKNLDHLKNKPIKYLLK